MISDSEAGVKTQRGECGDDVAGLLMGERRSLDILPGKKEAKLCASVRRTGRQRGGGFAVKQFVDGLLKAFQVVTRLDGVVLFLGRYDELVVLVSERCDISH